MESQPKILASIQSAVLVGIRAIEVEISAADACNSLAWVWLEGSGNRRALAESETRVRVAISNTIGGAWKLRQISIKPINPRNADALAQTSLAPLDLAIALVLLAAQDKPAIPPSQLAGKLAIGELSLSGAVLPVRGAIPMARIVTERVLVSSGVVINEARIVVGMKFVRAERLADAIERIAERPEFYMHAIPPRPSSSALDFADVKGLQSAVGDLEKAAVLRKHVLIIGASGSGATMLARRLSTILPTLTEAEALEVASIHSASGRSIASPITERPVRAPHHTIGIAGLVGGGNGVRPGEMTLAHHGVLILADLPGFARATMEAVGHAARRKSVVVHRSGETESMPADCQIVATAGACPCGDFDHRKTSKCKCSDVLITRWRARIDGLRSMFGIVIELPAANPANFDSRTPAGETSAAIRERVIAERARLAESVVST